MEILASSWRWTFFAYFVFVETLYVRGGRQVEAEFARINARLDETLAEMSVTVSSSREAANAYADQVANFDLVLRQFVENNSGRVAASSDDGDAQERQR